MEDFDSISQSQHVHRFVVLFCAKNNISMDILGTKGNGRIFYGENLDIHTRRFLTKFGCSKLFTWPGFPLKLFLLVQTSVISSALCSRHSNVLQIIKHQIPGIFSILLVICNLIQRKMRCVIFADFTVAILRTSHMLTCHTCENALWLSYFVSSSDHKILKFLKIAWGRRYNQVSCHCTFIYPKFRPSGWLKNMLLLIHITIIHSGYQLLLY